MPMPDPSPGSDQAPLQPDADLYRTVERELHGIAARLLQGERVNHTLQPTALMHEAWLRLVGVHQPWRDRMHFVRAAAGTMRRVLVEHGRARGRVKRGAGAAPVTLSTEFHPHAAPPDDVLAVDEALQRLAALDPELERIVELRVFGGLEHQEIATVTGSSLRTVERGWRLARAFLCRALGDEDEA
jgi:RNA polymerase sigma factor (TIGR02999 family)